MRNYLSHSGTSSGSEFCRPDFSRRQFQSLLFLALMLFATMLQPAHSTDLSGEGYLITVDDADWGRELIYVWPNGIKKVLIKQKFTMVSRKPQWRVIAFRDEGRQICELSNQENPVMTIPAAAKVTRIKTGLKGLPVIKETYPMKPAVFDETETMVGQFMPSGHTAKTRVIVVGNESFRLDVQGFSPALVQAAGRVMRVIPSDGVVVENKWILSDGKRLPGINLVAWKRVRVKDSDFVPPPNYQSCRSFKEFQGKSITAEMDDLAKQMDFGEPLGKSTK